MAFPQETDGIRSARLLVVVTPSRVNLSGLHVCTYDREPLQTARRHGSRMTRVNGADDALRYEHHLRDTYTAFLHGVDVFEDDPLR